MTLAPGARLGPYEIVAPLGAGGMGEVYKARDMRLDRTVAIKVLMPEIAADPSFRSRFEREARMISALNHPRICILHDVGRQGDIDYLVFEHIEGESLAARLERGALRIPQVLKCAIEIADALEAAHRLGIVHRDLKPGNVMLTAGGAKLVDFGLARPTGHGTAVLSNLTTLVAPSTAQGTFVGTLQYMAPEQLQGGEPDARTDIFALGVVIHEMATGQRAFQGQTSASIAAKILETDPPPVSTLAPLAPSALDHLVQVCLAKDPSERWQTAHDVLVQLRWIQQEGSRVGVVPVIGVRRKARKWLLGAAVVIVAAAVTIGWRVFMTGDEPAGPLARLEIPLPPQLSLPDFGSPVLSPDGQRLVIPAAVDGKLQLYLRRLDDSSFLPIPGTDDARGPFWSPDSRSIGFFAGGKLRRIDVAGGSPVVLCDATGAGGSWNADGVILFGPGQGQPLFRIADEGGTPVPVTVLNSARKETAHRSPYFLPDGRTFLYLTGGPEGAIHAGSLDSKDVAKHILPDNSAAVYVSSGHMLFLRQGSLMAVPFDVDRLEASGEPLPVATDVRGGVSAALNGTLVYRTRDAGAVQLTWFTRDGKRLAAVGGPGPYRQIALSPSGRRVAIQQGEPGFALESGADLWLMDLTTGVHSRLTNHPAFDADPAWAPDERSLAFTSTRIGRHQLFRKDLLTGAEEQLADLPDRVVVDEWTPDGRYLIFRNIGASVYTLPMNGDRTPKLLADTPYQVDQSHVSPDGRWIAFNANESDNWEVYVARFPDFVGKRQISSGGGMQPVWRGDSRELFYLTPKGHVMAVAIGTDPSMAAVPRPLFRANLFPRPDVGEYGVTGDGQRFLIAEPTQSSQTITFLLHRTLLKTGSGQSR